MDSALNNLQRLTCHKTKTTSQPTRTLLNTLVGFGWSVIFICLYSSSDTQFPLVSF